MSYKKGCPQTLRNHPFYGFKLDPEQQQFVDYMWDDKYRIVFCNSKAGTGKTQLATGVANLLYEYKDYDGIVYIVSPYGEDKQGFLPGDITKKSEIYYEPFYQSLIKCGLNPFTVIDDQPQISEKRKDSECFIRCFTHTYLRGVNLEKKIIILDEAQNFTFSDLKKTLTRISDTCKTIVIGHTGQIDLTNKKYSGFCTYFGQAGYEDFAAVCTLSKNYRGIVSTWADSIGT